MNFMPILIMNILLLIITIVIIITDMLFTGKKEAKIVINNERTLKVNSGSYLLNTLSENRIFIPSACGGKATCGHCKVKVKNGNSEILPTEEIFLSNEEINKGYRISCQVKIRDDFEISLPDNLLDVKEYNSTVIAINDLTKDVKFLKLKLNDPADISFKPGQYIQIRIPGVEEFRAYSIASQPSIKDILDLTIKLIPKGLCSTYVHKVLNIGDNVNFTGPYGDFFLRENSNKDIICIARSCGMAPIRSIIYHLVEKGFKRNVTYFFNVRTKEDLFFIEEFRNIENKFNNFKFIPALSRPKSTDKWDGEIGRITYIVDKYITNAKNLEAYLCGPAPMIDHGVKVLLDKGIDKNNIFYDKY